MPIKDKEKAKLYQLERAKKLKENGLCRKCKSPTVGEKAVCEKCLAKDKDRKITAVINGICRECLVKPLIADTKKCLQCTDKQKLKDTRRRLKVRKSVFEAYGAFCACCGENGDQFLSVDHIEGNGAAHREEINGDRRGGGRSLYDWLVKNNFPPGFQVLCHNCNFAKGTDECCPHQNNTVIRHQTQFQPFTYPC